MEDNNGHPKEGLPIVVSAPSGGGKTTLCRRLMDRLKRLSFSVSHTTRLPRAKEQEGIDYHFVDEPTFQSLVKKGAFLEWAWVYGHLYGTRRQETQERLSQGYDVLFDIDIQGGQHILERLPHAVLIFVVPPDLETLEERLRARRSDSEETIEKRLQQAADEIRHATFYHYWVINDGLEQAVSDLEAIVRVERWRRVSKQMLMRDIVGRLG